MKNMKNGFMATCVLATVLGAQLAAFAWTGNPGQDGDIIGGKCANIPANTVNRTCEACVAAKCLAVYHSIDANGNGVQGPTAGTALCKAAATDCVNALD